MPRHRHFAFMAAPRTLLVHPDGSPVGGVWQRWVDQARVPTPSGLIVLVSPQRLCWAPGSAPGGGCSSGGAPWELAATDRGSLYTELGHIFDARYLRGWERASLARRWGVPGARWSDSSSALDSGLEDGLMVAFAEVYGDCASGDESAQSLAVSSAPAITTGAWACRFIRSLG